MHPVLIFPLKFNKAAIHQKMKNAFLFSLLAATLFSCQKTPSEWQVMKVGFNDDFHDIIFTGGTHLIGYSYGSGLIIKSEDQGQSWKKVHTTDSIYWEQVRFPSDQIGFICGNSNRIIKTEDGGDTWFEITIDSLHPSSPIYGMDFVDIETGYISVIGRTAQGFQTTIYQTVNSGLDWSKINTIPEMIINLELVDGQLWGSGNNLVAKNIDKADWKEVYRDTTRQVGQIRDFTISNDELIMASFSGYIIRKADGGVITQQITPNRLRSIISVGEGLLITAGDNDKEQGNLFESADNGISWKRSEKVFSDIHRLKTGNENAWGIGKNDEVMKLKL